MNLRAIAMYISHILLLEAAFMLPAVGIGIYRGEMSAVFGLGMAVALLLVAGLCLRRKGDNGNMYASEGFVVVALGWILLCVFGAIPFYLSGAIPSVIDSWFETVSGFTTTGATILTDIEAMPKSLLYWRSFTQWLGGMGVLVFMLAVVPLAKGKGETMHLMRAESPGPAVGKLTPTLRHTARILYLIYIGMTVLQVVLMLLGGMPLFDSVVNALVTAGTGGYGIKANSIAAYDSAYLQTVIAVFMMLFGINFSLYYLVLTKQARDAFKNEELRVYLLLIAAATLVIALDIFPYYDGNVGKAVLDSFFQVSSIITTTGFSTADYNLWPELSRYLLVLLMLCGACAGSTGGGMKISRMLILYKSLRAQLQRMLRPRSVKPVQLDGKNVSNEVVQGTHAFLVAYAVIVLASVLLLSFDEQSMETNIGAVVTSISNVGPGLDRVGPVGNFAFFSPLSKIVLCADMLLGRLEIFPLLLLFAPYTWKRKA